MQRTENLRGAFPLPWRFAAHENVVWMRPVAGLYVYVVVGGMASNKVPFTVK